MSLSFSNFPINEVRLSDKLGNGLGKEISVYLKTQSCESLDDCVKVADLKVTRYNHDRNTVKINADDKWLESFYVDLPRTLLEKDKNTFEYYHLKPVPILYGHLENAPALPYYDDDEDYSFREDGVKIIPDKSYFTAESDIQGIKHYNREGLDGNIRTFDEMHDPNILKIRLSDSLLASMPVNRYINTNADLANKIGTYRQYKTYGDYIKINLPSASIASGATTGADIDTNRAGFWCSYISHPINKRIAVYTITSSGNYLRNDYTTGDGVTMNNITSGYLTATSPSHNIGIMDIEFEELSGADIYENENGDSSPSDVQILGEGKIKYVGTYTGPSEGFENFKIYSIHSPYEFDESVILFADALNNIATPSSWDFYGTLTDDIDLLNSKGRNDFIVKGHRGVINEQDSYYLSSFNSRFGSTNAFKSEIRDPAIYPIMDANTVVLYYTPSDDGMSYPDTSSGNPEHTMDIETDWSNLKLRKYWKNRDVFLKDFFVNAKGRIGNPLSNVNQINAQIKVFYEGADTPSGDGDFSFTKKENLHLSELYKLLTDNKYKTKLLNGELYELMLCYEGVGGSPPRKYIYDIDVNNLESTSSFDGDDVVTDGGSPFYDEHTQDYHQTTHGWVLDITGKNWGNYDSGLQAANGQHWDGEDNAYLLGFKLMYGKVNYSNNQVDEIIHSGISTGLSTFNNINGFTSEAGESRCYVKCTNTSENITQANHLLESPEEIIDNLFSSEMNINDITTITKSGMKIGFSINEQKNTKEIVENICKQSNVFFRYNPTQGKGIIDTIKREYSHTDIDKTIETDRILKYSFNKTKIDDLCFGGCRVKWGWDYGKKESIGITEDAKVESDYLDAYLEEYGVADAEKYQLEVEAPYINNEATAINFRNFLFQFYKNTHLTLKVTLALQDGIELEVGDIIAFDKDIGGLRPYGKSIAKNHTQQGLEDGYGWVLIDQQIYPYFIITSASKTLDKVDLEVVQLHKTRGIAIIEEEEEEVDDTGGADVVIAGCTDEGANNYNADAIIDNGTCEYSTPPNYGINLTTDYYDADGNEASYLLEGHSVAITMTSINPDVSLATIEWTIFELIPPPLGSNDWVSLWWMASSQNWNDDNNPTESINIPLVGDEYSFVPNDWTGFSGKTFRARCEVSFYDAEGVIITEGFENEVTFEVDYAAPALGDVNADGEVNVQDLVLVISHIIGTSETPFTQDQLVTGDMNEDNSVDVHDLILMVNVLLEIE